MGSAEERKEKRLRHIKNPEPGSVVTNNQVQLGPIIAAHYNSARRGIEVWIERRDQYISYYITAVTAIAGLYFNVQNIALVFLGLIPASSLMFLSAYYSADIHIAHVSKWLQDEYSEILDHYAEVYGVFSLRDAHWDNSVTLRDYWKTGARSRYWFFGAILVLSNAAVAFEVGDKNLMLSVFAVAVMVTSLIVVFCLYRGRKTMTKTVRE